MPDRHETKHRKKHQSKRAPSKTETVTGHDQLAEHLPRVDDKVEVKEITIRPGSETGTFYLVLDNLPPNIDWPAVKDWMKPVCQVYANRYPTGLNAWVRLEGLENCNNLLDFIKSNKFYGHSLSVIDHNKDKAMQLSALWEDPSLKDQKPSYSGSPNERSTRRPPVSKHGGFVDVPSSHYYDAPSSWEYSGENSDNPPQRFYHHGYSRDSVPYHDEHYFVDDTQPTASYYSTRGPVRMSPTVPVIYATTPMYATSAYADNRRTDSYRYATGHDLAVSEPSHLAQREWAHNGLESSGTTKERAKGRDRDEKRRHAHESRGKEKPRKPRKKEREPRPTGQVETELRKILVLGLDKKTKPEAAGQWLHRYLDDPEHVLDVEVQRRRSTGYAAGGAYVLFTSHKAAKKTVDRINGDEKKGRKLSARFTTEGVGSDSDEYVYTDSEAEEELARRQPLVAWGSNTKKPEGFGG